MKIQLSAALRTNVTIEMIGMSNPIINGSDDDDDNTKNVRNHSILAICQALWHCRR